ncbi:hypothetical protein J6590_048431 [Homalodisca vitripennis]|nr:hypothetical protein J6590_048431 [Homalodisca vitripennis]
MATWTCTGLIVFRYYIDVRDIEKQCYIILFLHGRATMKEEKTSTTRHVRAHALSQNRCQGRAGHFNIESSTFFTVPDKFPSNTGVSSDLNCINTHGHRTFFGVKLH